MADNDDEEITLADAIAVLAKVMDCTPQEALRVLLKLQRDGEMPIIAREVKKPGVY